LNAGSESDPSGVSFMKQLVSILIPAFNSEKWIRPCIESALAQTWRWKEIIIVDDGSKDSTLEIARMYACPDIQVMTQDNRGASAARNRALSVAQGDYIQWLDSDDLLAPDKISRQMHGAEPGLTSEVLLSGSWGRFHHVPEKSEFVPDSLWEDLEPREWLYRKIHENLWMAIESWLVSRKLTEAAGPWDEQMSLDDDGEYFCRVLSHSVGVRFVPEARCFCRSVSFGLSHPLAWSDRKLDSQFASLSSYIRLMRSMEDSPKTRTACLELIERWAPPFYTRRPDLYRQMQAVASDLGGQLGVPRLQKKYRWMQRLFGWRIASKAQNMLPLFKAYVRYAWERGVSGYPGGWK